MNIIRPPKQFHAGSEGQAFRKMLEEKSVNTNGTRFALDLSNVDYMDTFSFRIVFDFLPMFITVTPPDPFIVNRYNIWVDSKKGLSK